MVLHSSFADFILFVFVHMSHADNSYDPLEIAAIKEKMKDIYDVDTDFERKLYLTIRQYNDFDKSKLNALLADSFQHFNPDYAVSTDVFRDLQEIMQADGAVNRSEKNALESVRRLIDLHGRT
jgi:uncharacterized tellurite resistance protein B-like protein